MASRAGRAAARRRTAASAASCAARTCERRARPEKQIATRFRGTPERTGSRKSEDGLSIVTDGERTRKALLSTPPPGATLGADTERASTRCCIDIVRTDMQTQTTDSSRRVGRRRSVGRAPARRRPRRILAVPVKPYVKRCVGRCTGVANVSVEYLAGCSARCRHLGGEYSAADAQRTDCGAASNLLQARRGWLFSGCG